MCICEYINTYALETHECKLQCNPPSPVVPRCPHPYAHPRQPVNPSTRPPPRCPPLHPCSPVHPYAPRVPSTNQSTNPSVNPSTRPLPPAPSPPVRLRIATSRRGTDPCPAGTRPLNLVLNLDFPVFFARFCQTFLSLTPLPHTPQGVVFCVRVCRMLIVT